MREILFRGKRVDNGEWVEGFYVSHQKPGFQSVYKHFIVHYEADVSFWHEVCPDTVGQYTGLKDKECKRIFEEDVLKNIDGICLVSWDEEKSAFVMRLYEYPYETLYLEEMWDDSEIIGNIHDNPELLENP